MVSVPDPCLEARERLDLARVRRSFVAAPAGGDDDGGMRFVGTYEAARNRDVERKKVLKARDLIMVRKIVSVHSFVKSAC